ncbi:MAG TPA: hypothetical protein VMW85_01240 [Methanomassiliicoccales archaeon]|nr:hypothetical protein [Methanomassiliicoccales archaeon]
MKVINGQKCIVISLILMVVLVSTAYLAAGALNDKLVPDVDEPVIMATITFEQVNTNGLGGTDEHPSLTNNVINGIEYDTGIRMRGLMDEERAVLKFYVTQPGISIENAEAYYFDWISLTWNPITFIDQGDTLVGAVGPVGGQEIFEGFNQLNLIIISFSGSDSITFGGYVEPAV